MPLTRGKAVGYDADLRIYIALAIGQVLISQVDIMGSTAFNIVVAFFAIALALVSLTHAEPPQMSRSLQ